MKKLKMILFPILVFLILFLTGGTPAYSMGFWPPPQYDPPPWEDPDPYDPPPSAPEPLSLILIGMGASGAAGYFIGKRKNRKDE